MIQRKQTLFLIFSIILMAGYLFAPVLRVDSGNAHTYVKGSDMVLNVDFPVIGRYFVFIGMIPALVMIAINLGTVFLYKSRNVQVFLCWLSIIPAIFTICYVYYRMMTSDMTQDQYYYYGNVTPVVAIVAVLAAIYYIRKDEELVKSVDRLR